MLTPTLFTAGVDYIPLQEVEVTFSPGNFVQRVSLESFFNVPIEGDEDLFANIVAVDPRVGVFHPQARVTIIEEGKYIGSH